MEVSGVVFKTREVYIGDVLTQSYNYNQEIEVLKTKVFLNRNQCANICKSLGHVIKVFEGLRACSNERSKYKVLFCEFQYTTLRMYMVIKDCAQ